MKSPIGWVGGKSRSAKRIVTVINTVPHKTFVELAVGGGSVFFEKNPSAKEVLNDINRPLMDFYRDLKNGVDINKCNTFPSKDKFFNSKSRLYKGKETICDFLLVNKHSFGGDMYSYAPNHQKSCTVDKRTGKKRDMIDKCGIEKLIVAGDNYRKRLENTHIMNDDYRVVVKKLDSPETVFYFDPPYEGNVSRRYRTDLSAVTPEKIASVFRNIKGRAVISFNDSPTVRSAFKGFNIIPLTTHSSLNSKFGSKNKINELIITNFPVKG